MDGLPAAIEPCSHNLTQFRLALLVSTSINDEHLFYEDFWRVSVATIQLPAQIMTRYMYPARLPQPRAIELVGGAQLHARMVAVYHDPRYHTTDDVDISFILTSSSYTRSHGSNICRLAGRSHSPVPPV